MPKAKDKKPGSMKALLEDLVDEIDDEKFAGLKPEEQILESLAREILLFERDMTVPGTPTSDSARVERLSKFIEDRDF